MLGYDSAAHWANIPADAPLLFWYVDGAYATPQSARARFPRAIFKSITVLGGTADFADVENGDLTIASGARWARTQRAFGRRPGLYVDRSNYPDLVQACAELSISPSMVDWWIADATGQPHSLPGACCVQYGQVNGYDVSTTSGAWVGVDIPLPSPVPSPPTTSKDEMALLLTDSKGAGYVVANDLTSKVLIPDANDMEALVKIGAPAFTYVTQGSISDAVIDAIPPTT
jgi:hypothetical protein